LFNTIHVIPRGDDYSCQDLEHKLRRLDRRLSKKKKKSKNREKAKKRLQKLHYKIVCIRLNYIHEITSFLAKTKQVIVIEDLEIITMKYQKLIKDASFGQFRYQLSYKCPWYGSLLLIANHWFASSKICSSCSCKNENLKLSERSWICSKCGMQHDRDINAAINLKNESEKLLKELKNVPVSCRDQATSQRRKKSVEKPLAAELIFRSTSNVIDETESEYKMSQTKIVPVDLDVFDDC
jgi:putative transposase